MKSQITEDFVAAFRSLPDKVKEVARKNYRLWLDNPFHPSLHFKRVHAKDALYSVRVGSDWRALGLLEGDTMTWFWIGSHAEYDHLISAW